MAEEENKKLTIHEEDLEKENPTGLQRKIEEKIEKDEETMSGEQLSGELSKDRTHMSEHRTKMSEHRTDLSEHRTGLSEHRTSLSEQRTDMSLERTALSYERTLMSWIRTATSLISFGFTIYKFFEEVQKQTAGPHLFSPRVVGMIMIGFGVVGLLFAEIQHLTAYNKLKKEYPGIQLSLSSILGALLLAVGLILFFAALFRQ